MKRLAAVALMLGSSLALAQFTTPQYLPFKMVNGQSDPFRYYLDNRTATPGNLSLQSVQTATLNAWDTWNAVSCAVPKTVSNGFTSGIVPDPSDPYDAFNVNPVWIVSNTDKYYFPLFGSSYVKGTALPFSFAGMLVNCDVYLNGVGINWSVSPATPAGSVDLETVLLHEMGHCLGLEHWQEPGGVPNVMTGAVQEGFQRRSLASPEDVSALCDRNPVQGGVGSPCLADGGCGGSVGQKCVNQPLTSGFAKFCTVGCTTGTGAVCELPLYCEPSTFFNPASNGACLRATNTVTKVGAACTLDNQCNSSLGKCQPEDTHPSGYKRWFQGYCYQTCAVGQPMCPAGSQCTNIGEPVPICLLSCRVGLADCRNGYSCAQTVNGGVCIPSCFADADCGDVVNVQCRTCDGLCVGRQNNSGRIGDLCTMDAQCGAGQVCTALDPSKPTKQCTIGCAAGCGTCPTGSGCQPLPPSNSLACLRTCTGAGTCPLGARCANLPTGRACLPACTNSLDCPVGQDCNNGECYNPGEDDAGCGAFCGMVDAGKPIPPIKKDAGTGGGGTGGCGCSTSGELSGLLAMLFVGFGLSRRGLRKQ